LLIFSEFKSSIFTKFIGAKTTVGSIRLLPLTHGKLIIEDITIYSSKYTNIKAFRIDKFQIDIFKLLMGKNNEVVINELILYYTHKNSSNILRNTVKKIYAKRSHFSKHSDTECIQTKIHINYIKLYGGDNIFESDILELTDVNIKCGTQGSDPIEVFDELNFIYYSPIRTLSYPKIMKVKYNDISINWSIFTTYSFYRKTVQVAFLNMGFSSDGVQVGLMNYEDDGQQTQVGIFNISEDSKLLQFGLINYGQNSNSLQLGILNINTKSFIPVTILINFGSPGGATSL